MNIEKCENGYILTKNGGSIYIATNIQEIFARMLDIFEHRSEVGWGDKYGKVIVELKDSNYSEEDV